VRPRFLADCNVGRLARWLRALGYDAEYQPAIADAELVRRGLAEGLVVLTRDADLARRRPVATGSVRLVLLASDRVGDQLRQVKRELALDDELALTRCLECNVALVPRRPDEVDSRVPPLARARATTCSECTECGRVYWDGTHWRRMREALAAL
jgi:uncharacterized protein